jgi:hypothetical protein
MRVDLKKCGAHNVIHGLRETCPKCADVARASVGPRPDGRTSCVEAARKEIDRMCDASAPVEPGQSVYISITCQAGVYKALYGYTIFSADGVLHYRTPAYGTEEMARKAALRMMPRVTMCGTPYGSPAVFP